MTTARTPLDNMIQDPELSDMLVKHVDQIKEYHLRNAARDTNGQFCRVGDRFVVDKLTGKKIYWSAFLKLTGKQSVNYVPEFPVGGIVSGDPTGILIPKAEGVHEGGKIYGSYKRPGCNVQCNISPLHGSYAMCKTCGKIIQ